MKKALYKFSTPTRIITLSFLLVIFIGAGLLCLPCASKSGESAGFLTALFTATSSTCVTGLILCDTYTQWTLFGQLVILFLIQVGGLGFMSFIAMFALVFRKRIGLSERKLFMQSSGSAQLGGVMGLMKRILIGTFIFEGAGAVILATRFCPMMGWSEGIYNAVFHSVSAFCNAGFDIMGKYGQCSSFSSPALQSDVTVNITLMALIVTGGTGFIVWSDILKCKLRIRRYELHTKIVLISTFFLIVGGAALFMLLEWNYSLAAVEGTGNKIMAGFFQAISPRTAGFNTVELSSLSEGGKFLSSILMLIGGSPGSTAGGMKTTTIVILILGAVAAGKHTDSIKVLRRRVEPDAYRQASAIFTVYMLALSCAVIIICAVEPYSLSYVFYEVCSAIGTAGLTLGITSSLSVLSKIILIILMFSGRVGGLSLMLTLGEKRVPVPIDRPEEKIIIG